MKRRDKYMMIIITAVLGVNIGGTLILLGLLQTQVIDTLDFRFYFMVANFAISVMIMFFIWYEGRFYKSTTIIALAFIASRFIDAYLYYDFPTVNFDFIFVYMYIGGFIFMFSLVYLNTPILRERFTFLLIPIAGLILLRVLLGTDILLMYVEKYVIKSRRNLVYFTGVMGLFYPMLFFLTMALNSISIDNHIWHRSSNMNEYQRKRVEEKDTD